MKAVFSSFYHGCLLLCAAAIPTPAPAQAPAVNLRFVSFPKADNPEPLELLLAEGQTMEVELPTNSISKTYTVPALPTWALGKSAVDEEGNSTFQSYGQARSLEADEQLILVVRKGPDDATGLELIPINNSGDGFGGGKYLLLNASTVDIGGSIGTARFALQPGKQVMLAPQPTSTEADRAYCFTRFYFRMGEESEPFFSSTWRFNEQARSMVFFYHDSRSRQLRIHTIRSFAR